MTLKIKDKIFVCRNCILDNIVYLENRFTGVCLWTEYPAYPDLFLQDPDPGDPKRLDPTGSISVTLVQVYSGTYIYQSLHEP